MKLVDTKNNKFVDADPSILEPGTPIPASSMNAIQSEICNVITGYGLTIDETNDSQMKEAIDSNFAPIKSPTLTGIPLTSNPDGTINNQIATVDYVNQKALQATVGFTPVQQSGGTDQGANKIYVGADKTDATQVRIQIDQSDIGKVVFQEENNDTYGIKQIGYNHTSDFISTLDSNNNYHNIHTADYIDSKQWISSLPDGNNLQVSDIIWNSSSSLPALYYGSDNSVAYLATETWANTTFQPTGNYAKTDAANTFQGIQTFEDTVTLTDAKSLQTIGGNGTVVVNRYADTSGTATTDISNPSTGANISWFRLYQDGMLRTSMGNVAFRGEVLCFAFGAITFNSSSVVASFSFLPSHDGYLKLDYNLGQASNNPVSNLEVTGSGFNIIGGIDNNSGTNLRVGSALYSVVAGQQVIVNMTGTYTASGSQTAVGGTAIYIPK